MCSHPFLLQQAQDVTKGFKDEDHEISTIRCCQFYTVVESILKFS